MDEACQEGNIFVTTTGCIDIIVGAVGAGVVVGVLGSEGGGRRGCPWSLALSHGLYPHSNL